MSSVLPSTGRRHLLLIAGILLIASTLRVTFTGAAPLLDAIRADYGLSTAQTGMLTTLPLLAFGSVSPLAAGVGRRLGIERSLLVALVLICLGIGLRSLPSTALLFGGTAIIGAELRSVTFCCRSDQTRFLTACCEDDRGLLDHYGRSGRAGFSHGGAAGAGGFRLARRALDVNGLSALALLVWLPQTRKTATAPLTGSGAMHNRGIWRSALAWQVTLFLGINSLVYYVIIGWLPAILQSLGYSEAQAGSLHGLLQLATAAPGWRFR